MKDKTEIEDAEIIEVKWYQWSVKTKNSTITIYSFRTGQPIPEEIKIGDKGKLIYNNGKYDFKIE